MLHVMYCVSRPNRDLMGEMGGETKDDTTAAELVDALPDDHPLKRAFKYAKRKYDSVADAKV